MAKARKGFTLIELVVVVLVIGILAGIVVARFINARESAYIAAMKSDLRNFAVYEQIYSNDNAGAYFSGNGIAQGFTPTPQVTVTATAAPGPPPTWQALAVHARTAKTCSIGTNGNPSSLDITCP
jgi:prepilin-type N-terminal cleavage/methylation domain-containing protein